MYCVFIELTNLEALQLHSLSYNQFIYLVKTKDVFTNTN